MTREAVITGMGVICPSGNTLEEFQRNLWGGVVSLERIELPSGEGEYAAVWGGRVRNFDPKEWLDDRVIDGTDLGQQFAIVAAELAKQDAGIETFDPRRTAIVSGSSIGGAISLQYAQYMLEKKGAAAVPAKTMIRIFANMAASQMAMRWGLHGPQMTLVQACATGVDVVGTAAQLVRSGVVDVAIAGGYEATNGFDHGLDPDFIPAMVAAQVTYGMAPDLDSDVPSRPFDKNRTGVVTGEAAAYVIVESAEHAAARGRTPWARIEGYGSLADAFHPSSPDPSGRWEREVMQVAMDDAGITPAEIDAVIAHGTATRKGDDSEIAALNDLFGDREVPLPATSIKGHMGHPGAASGCLAVIAAALAIREKSLVHTAGTTDVEDTIRFEVVIEKPKPLDIRTVLVNAFGFGGQNAAIVLGAPR